MEKLYGPTIADQRDKATCEACKSFIGHDDCYVYDAPGPVALVCVTCAGDAVFRGQAVVERAS